MGEKYDRAVYHMLYIQKLSYTVSWRFSLQILVTLSSKEQKIEVQVASKEAQWLEEPLTDFFFFFFLVYLLIVITSPFG